MAEANRGSQGQLLARAIELARPGAAKAHGMSRRQWGRTLAAVIRRLAQSSLSLDALRKRHLPQWVLQAVLRDRLPQSVRSAA